MKVKNIINGFLWLSTFFKIGGEGTFKDAHGNEYKGKLKNGKMQGQGILKFSNGERYEGEFKDGNIHGQGTLISPSGNIITTGKYCDGILTELQSVTIKEGEKTHFFEYKDDKIFYVESDAKEKIEIDLKINKRILSVLEQFANTQVNQKSDDDSDLIKVQDSEDFQRKIRELQGQSKRDKSTIVKMIGIFGHAFNMVFENGECSCFDNGGLSSDEYQDYFKKLQNNNTEYRKLNSSDSLTLQTIDGKKIQILIDPQDFICRHLAKTVFEKLKELNSQPRTSGLVERFLEYYDNTDKVVRINSFKTEDESATIGSGHSCPSIVEEGIESVGDEAIQPKTSSCSNRPGLTLSSIFDYCSLFACCKAKTN